MTSWREANTNAAVMAARIQAELEIDTEKPIDVFAAVKELGLVLAFAQLGSASGAYVPGEPRAGIILHEGHPRTRQRYTAAHELGHHAFEHAVEVDLDLEEALMRSASERWPGHEKEAEAFAAWFLMPQSALRSGLGRLGIERPRDPYDVYALSLWLGTSYTATARQLAVTRMVGAGDAEQWARIPPRNLKQALAGELAPDDLRNDVWLLDERHHLQPVDTRPGDRIVLTLPEIPSSGFSWQFTSKPAQMELLADSYTEHWEPDLSLEAEAARGESEEELAGEGPRRSFVLEIDPGAEVSIDHLALAKSQPWEAKPASGEFELLISVTTPMHGVQVPESELVLRDEGTAGS